MAANGTGGGGAKARGIWGEIRRLGQNRNAQRSIGPLSGGRTQASNILSIRDIYRTAISRGYAKQEAATLAKQVSKANRQGNSVRAGKLTQGVYSEFRPTS